MSCPTIFYDGPIVSRKEALEKGLKRYFTGKHCPRGHNAQRFTSGSQCLICTRIRANEHKLVKKDIVNATRRKHYKKNRDRLNTKKLAYRSIEGNREKDRQYSRSRYMAKREDLLAVAKRKRNEQPEKIRDTWKRYYDKHADKLRERSRQYAKENPEKQKAAAHNRRYARKGEAGILSREDVAEIYKKQKGKCLNCLCKLKSKYHVDHRIPLAKGGKNVKSNIDILCGPCNQRKSAKHPHVFARQEGRLL